MQMLLVVVTEIMAPCSAQTQNTNDYILLASANVGLVHTPQFQMISFKYKCRWGGTVV